MFEKIVAAVDEAENAERVLAATRELATMAGCEVWVIHVLEREPWKFGAISIETAGDAQAIAEAAAEAG